MRIQMKVNIEDARRRLAEHALKNPGKLFKSIELAEVLWAPDKVFVVPTSTVRQGVAYMGEDVRVNA